MSIATEIQRLQQAKADIAEAIVAKGGEVSGTLDTYAQAIEALPSGGGGSVACLEGDITLTATNFYFRVTHNLGKKAIYAVAIFDGEVANWVPYYAFVDGMCGGGIVNNSSGVPAAGGMIISDSTTSIYRPHNEDDFVQFVSGNTSSYKFPVGTYHYKIYYAI